MLMQKWKKNRAALMLVLELFESSDFISDVMTYALQASWNTFGYL